MGRVRRRLRSWISRVCQSSREIGFSIEKGYIHRVLPTQSCRSKKRTHSERSRNSDDV